MTSRIAALGCCILLSLPAFGDSCIWFSDDDAIRQVRTDVNQVTATVRLSDPHRLVMNASDCGVWTLDKRDQKLLRYGENGALQREIRTRSLDSRFDEVELLELDPYDGSLWAANDRRLFHVSADGQLLKTFSAPDEIRRVSVALDQRLWVLGKRQLWLYDPQGILVASYTLGSHLAGDARHFVVDSLGGLLWLADDDELAQLLLSNPTQPSVRIHLSRDITAMALDPAGKVWLASGDKLLAYSRAGALLHTVDLDRNIIRDPEKLAFDPVSRSLWVGAQRSLARFTDTGAFVARFSGRDGDEALGAPAFQIAPTLALIRPAPNALTRDPRPQFTLAYGAQCNGAACSVGTGFFGPGQLNAILNGQAIGTQFVLEPNAAQANFTPAARLPEGQNTFSAQIKDAFGHLSNTAAINFVIDTVAPTFLTLLPADGAQSPVPNVVIQGTVDDPNATVTLAAAGFSHTGASFSFPVVLQAGLNTFSVSATDLAGNSSVAALRLTYVPVAPVGVSIEAPAGGASVNGDSVLVSGTFQGPANTGVTVNGVVAAMDGSRFYAVVALQAGANQLNAVVTSPEGASATHVVSVDSTGIAAISVTANNAYGVAPFKAAFRLDNSSGRTITRIDVDYNGDGTADFTTANPAALLQFTYTSPGIYLARFTVTDDQAGSYVVVVPVQAQDPVRLDQQLKAVWNGFSQALSSRDKAAAMKALTVSAQERYGRVLDALMSVLPEVAASVSAPQTAQLGGSVGEYFVTRPLPNGGEQLFLIYFLRDSDGVWRLDTM